MSKYLEADVLTIGGGPVGMACGALLKSPVVTLEVAVPRGPVYLYDNEWNRRLLDIVGIEPPTTSRIAAAFLVDGRLVQTVDQQTLDSYGKKTARSSYKHPNTSFTHLNVNWESLMSKLESQTPMVIKEPIIHIDVNHRTVSTNDGVIHYNHLISTIPAVAFTNLSNMKFSLYYLPVKMTVDALPLEWPIEDIVQYDYVYIMDEGSSKLRWTKINGDVGYMEEVVQPGAHNMMRVVSGSVPFVPNVTFLGRFARWEENRLLSDDFKTIIEGMPKKR